MISGVIPWPHLPRLFSGKFAKGHAGWVIFCSILLTLPALHNYKNVFNRRMSIETKRMALPFATPLGVVILLLSGSCTFGVTVEATDPFLPQIVEPFKDPSNSIREAAARPHICRRSSSYSKIRTAL
jgi:hypothetical protein